MTDRVYRARESETLPTREPKSSTPSNVTRQRPVRLGQATLAVGSVDDPLEHEADEVAALVVRTMQAPTGVATSTGGRISRAPAVGSAPGSRYYGQVRRRVQRAAVIGSDGGDLDPDTEQSLQSARSGGRSIDAPVQRQLGDALGADVSKVRLHTGAQSASLNEQMGASAFTLGNDVFFRGGLPDTSSAAGLGLLAHEVTHTVQQGASPIRRRLEGDETEGAEASETESSETENSENSETENNETENNETESNESEVEEEGVPEIVATLPTIAPGPAPEETTGAGMLEEDGAGQRQARTRQAARSGSAASQRSHRIYLDADFGLSTSVRRSSSALSGDGDDDKTVARKIAVNTSIQSGLSSSPFGAMQSNYSMKNIELAAKGSTINVDATLEGSFTWGTNDGGKIDVSAADAGVVTEDTFEAIVKDLTPALKGKSWRASRQTYWSQAICERHEQYHAKDATKWTKSKAIGVIKTYLKKNPIELTDEERKDPGVVKAKVTETMEEARKAVVAGRVFYFRAGLGQPDYLNYPGEIRAFGDGKAPYQKLAKGVEKQGKKLAAAKAKKEKAAAKTSSGTSAPTETSV